MILTKTNKPQRELGWTNRGWARRGKLRLSKESTNSGQGKDRVQKTCKRKDYEAARELNEGVSDALQRLSLSNQSSHSH